MCVVFGSEGISWHGFSFRIEYFGGCDKREISKNRMGLDSGDFDY